ncbi:MAG: tripartite tricarboxylate transporter substrate binding protein [Burkholderiaceae bacterium]
MARSQSYPARPITLVVPVGVGSSADIVARLVAQQMAAQLGQSIVIENRPGAGGAGALKHVANGARDGYTLLLIGSGNALSQSLFKSPPYDVQRDLAPISDIIRTDIVVLAGKRSKLRSVEEFIANAQNRPGRLTVGTTILGTTQHMAAELLKASAKADFAIVPFKTSANLYAGVQSGDVELAFDLVPAVQTQLRAGELRALATAGDERSKLLPQVPTLKELGLVSHEVTSAMIIAAPSGTPNTIVELLGQEIQRALKQRELQLKLQDLGFTGTGSTPAQARELLASELTKWREVVRSTGVELQ